MKNILIIGIIGIGVMAIINQQKNKKSSLKEDILEELSNYPSTFYTRKFKEALNEMSEDELFYIEIFIANGFECNLLSVSQCDKVETILKKYDLYIAG